MILISVGDTFYPSKCFTCECVGGILLAIRQTLDFLRDIQTKNSRITERRYYVKVSRGRYLLMPHRFPHLLEPIQVGNDNRGFCNREEGVSTVVGHTRKEWKIWCLQIANHAFTAHAIQIWLESH